MNCKGLAIQQKGKCKAKSSCLKHCLKLEVQKDLGHKLKIKWADRLLNNQMVNIAYLAA